MGKSCWTQGTDYESADLGVLSLEQGAEKIRSFPWKQQCQEFLDGIERKDDVCPPGIGFNSANDKSIFHLYVEDANEWCLYLDLPRSGKILGIFSKPSKNLYIDVASLEYAVEVLGMFYADDYDRLAAESEKHPYG